MNINTSSPSLKILFLAPMTRIAMRHYLQALLDETDGEEFEVMVVAPSHTEVKTRREIRHFQGGHKISVLIAQLNPLTYWKIAKAIRDFRPDVVNVVNGDNRPMAVWAEWMARRAGARAVLTIHDPIPHPDAWLHRSTVWIGSIAACASDSLLLHSPYYMKEVQKTFGKPVFVFGLPDFTAAYPKAPVTQKEDLVLFFGRIEQYKGIENFVALGLQLDGRARFLLAGVGDIGAELRHKMTQHPDVFQVENRFVPDDELVAMMDRAKIVIMPYHSATQSGVPAAAVSRGAFPIGFAVGGLAEQLPELGGIAVPSGDLEALTAAVEKTLDLPLSSFETLRDNKPDFGTALRKMLREVAR